MLYSVSRLAVFLVVTLVTPSASFAAVSGSRFSHAQTLAMSHVMSDCGCTDVAEAGVVMNDVLVTGATLRSTELFDARGEQRSVGSVIGDGKAVVIFLRHLG